MLQILWKDNSMIFWIYAVMWLVCVWLSKSIVYGTILSVFLTCVITVLLAIIGKL